MTDQTVPPTEPTDTGAPAAQTPPPVYEPKDYAPAQPSKPNRWKGIARKVAVPVVVLAVGGIWGALHDAHRGEDGQITDKGDLSSSDVRAGDCLMLPKGVDAEKGTEVDKLTAVPCKSAHEAEAFALTKMKNPSYPGDAKVTAFANRYCARQFGAFIGKPYDKSALDMSYLYPTSGSWGQGDRNVTCVVSKAGAPSKGSLRGSKL